MARPRKGKRSASREANRKFPVRTVLIVLGWLGLLGAFGFGAYTLEQHVLQAPPQETRIEWVDLPAWLQEPQWADIISGIENAEHELDPSPLVWPDTNIHDDRVCDYVYTIVWRSPWVEWVDKVVKLRDGRVRVHASFRAPHAVVERNRRLYLIDSAGVRLPMEWGAEFEVPWLRISGSRGRLAAVGERFVGPDIQAGLQLATFLYLAEEEGQAPFLGQLEAVDVANYDQNLGRLRIFPKGTRSYIYWGHVPGGGLGVEASAERKLDVLRNVYERGRLIASSPYRISDGKEVTFISGHD